MFTSISPTFALLAGFADTGLPEASGPPYGANSNNGNVGQYGYTLQMCVVGNGVPTNPCTNFDGSTGTWTPVDSMSFQKMTPGNRQSSVSSLSLPTTGVFDEQNQARTLRLQLVATLADRQANGATGPGVGTETRYTTPFTALIEPSAFVQVKVQPLTIVYAPPGNQSTVTFTTTNSYMTNFTLGQSQTQTNKSTYGTTDSRDYALKMGVAYGSGSGAAANLSANGSATEGGGESWDATTSSSVGLQSGSQNGGQSSLGIGINYGVSADPATVPGNGMVCASATDCSTQVQSANWWAHQPFWGDTFYLMVHPQFAVYVIGNGTDRTVMYGAVPAVATVQVLSLWACANGKLLYGVNQCNLQYSDFGLKTINGKPPVYENSNNIITLTPDEAQQLLQLDPFYVGGQNASLDPTRAAPIASESYGTKIGQLRANPTNVTVNNTQVQSSANNGQTTYISSVTNAMTADSSSAWDWGASLIFSLGLTAKFSQSTKWTNQLDSQTIYSNSTAAQNQLVTQDVVTLNDLDDSAPGSSGKNYHNPLPLQPTVTVYLDKAFGGFMFDDGYHAAPIPASERAQFEGSFDLAALSENQEQQIQRFSDVPNGFPGKAAIGLAVRMNLMRGYSDGTFRPNAQISRNDLSTVLSSARLLAHNTEPLVAAQAVGPVTHAEMATALAGVFKTLPLRSEGYLVVHEAAFNPSAVTTRAEAAQALIAALKARAP